MRNTNKQAHKLIDEKSPYLLQRANHPMEWYPGVMKPSPYPEEITNQFP